MSRQVCILRAFVPALLTFWPAATLWSVAVTPVLAQAQKQEQKTTLRSVMQELGAEYLRLTNALLVDDFKQIEESAKAIAGHPLPDEIVTAIRNKLGPKFGDFERVDERSHEQADELARRAAAKDMSGAASAFGGLASGCVSCHEQFRATLKSLSD